MELRAYVDAYALANTIEPATVQYLSFAVAALDRWHATLPCDDGQLGPRAPVRVADLCDELANRWISARLSSGKSRKTVRVQRGAVLTLWRAAHADGLVRNPPARVKIVRVPTINPDAWWPDETARLLAAAETAPGSFPCGVRRAALLRAWLLVGYFTLLRPGDLRRLRHSDIAADGGVRLVQDKTDEEVLRCLPPDAMDAVKAIKGDQPTVFPVSAKTIRRWWLWLKRTAHVPGSPKWLRRTGATQCEIQQPGSAMCALGHKTPGLAYKSYVDRRQTQQKPPTPPKIW